MKRTILSILILTAILVSTFTSINTATANFDGQSLPVGDPASFLGNPSGTDKFDNSNNWTLFDDTCFRSEIKDGKYVMTSKGKQGFSCWEHTWPDLLNFYIDVEIEMPQTCDENDRFGVIFRAPSKKAAYLFGITCGGQYTFTSWDGEKTEILLPQVDEDFINTDPGTINRIGVGAVNDHFYFYINGQYINSTRDELFLEEGKIGFYIRAGTEEKFTARFDNLRVWSLEDDLNPPESPGSGYPNYPLNPPTATGATVTANTPLNVRSGPGMLFPVLTIVEKDTQGEVMGISPDNLWWAVKVPTELYGSGVAWTSRQYTTLSNPQNATIPVVQPPAFPPGFYIPQPNATQPQISVVESAVVRSGPSVEYPVYGVATYGTRAIVTGQSEDSQWWTISLPKDISADGTGWIFKGYTAAKNTLQVPVITPPAPPKDLSPLIPTTSAPSVVAVYKADIWSGPNSTYTRYGKVNPGAKLAAIGVSEDGSYYVVKLPSEIAPDGRGWIRADMVNTYNVKRLPTMYP